MGKIKKYTSYESYFIKENYKKLTIKELANELDRTEASIKHRIKRMKLNKTNRKKWNDCEIEYLKNNIKDKKIKDIASFLDRSIYSIKSKMYELNIKRNKFKEWTEEEISLLKNTELSNKNIKDILESKFNSNRTMGAIESKRRSIGIYLYNKRKVWTKEDDVKIFKYAGKMLMKDFAKKLECSSSAVSRRLKVLGVKWKQGTLTARMMSEMLQVSERTVINRLKSKYNFKNDRTLYELRPYMISELAKDILNNNTSLNNCGSTIKNLEFAAEGGYDEYF